MSRVSVSMQSGGCVVLGKALRQACFGSVVLIVAMSAAALAIPAVSSHEQDVYDVYSAYINEAFGGESDRSGAGGDPVLIAAEPASPDLIQPGEWVSAARSLWRLRQREKAPGLALVFGFALANVNPRRLEPKFNIHGGYVLGDFADIAAEDLKRRFSRHLGWLAFSSVSFSHDGTEALFYTENLCGLCGGGEYVLMRRTGGEWAIAVRYSVWAS